MKIQYLIGFMMILLATLGHAASNEQIIAKKRVIIRTTVGETIASNSPQYNSGWEGYYYGVLPCENCKGKAVWLHLKRTNNRGEYELREKFLGVKNRYSQGGLAWEKKGTIIKLMSNNNQKISLRKDLVSFIDENNMQKGSLKRIKSFYDQGLVFLLNEKSIQKGLIRGKKALKFSGITNYDIPTLDGYKSIKATYLVDCRSKDYEISRVAHYKDTFAMRGFVYPKISSLGEKNLITQVAQKYCR